MLRILAFAIVIAGPWAFAARRPVTIESLTEESARRAAAPGAVYWAPDGQRFAFVERRSLWMYEAASGSRKELLPLGALEDKAFRPPRAERFDWENRRVAEQTYQWANSGKEMLISAGGDLFLLHVDSGAWDQLTATAEAEHDPKLSPDGRYVSFRRGHDLYTLEIAGRKLNRLTHDGTELLRNAELDWVYPEELDLGTAHWWSPDSRSIAYLQFDVSREWRFPHADLLSTRAVLERELFPQPGSPNADVRLGVVEASGGVTRWMDLGETRDRLLARVYWAPDSRRIAAERLNRIQNRLDLFLADPASGSARIVLTEEDPYWINVNDDFRFLADARHFLWGSERDGYRHLYLYSLDGKSTRLTGGEWEVTQVACVDEKAEQVFFVATESSPLERQLYRVDFDGRHITRITKTPGTHNVSTSPSCEYYLDSASGLNAPPKRNVHRRDGTQLAVFHAAEASEYEILPTEIVKVKAGDGTLFYARLIKPAGFVQGRKYPVIVMIYGGPHAQTVRDVWTGPSWDQVLAQRGFVIWQLDNRGSAGRGHRWESAVHRNLGELELQDQRTGIRFLEGLGFADTSRMGIHGWSYGGYMTLYALLNAPDLFKVGIAGAPVTDWHLYDTIWTERYMGLPEENAEGYRRSSPIPKAGNLNAQLMLVHNLEDDNVHFQNTMQMADALEKAGRPFQMLIYP